MWILQCLVVLTLLQTVCWCQIWYNGRLRRQQQMLNLKTALNLKNKITQKINRYRERNTQSICYDVVGCFNLPHKNSPLQKNPEDPQLLNTKFYLYTRDTDFTKPDILFYDDNGKSLNTSSFKGSNLLKVIVHGYMSQWNDKGSIIMLNSYLKMYDCNVILMDWHIGARGPHYTVAAANTELVGRQLGILLTNMVQSGLDPRKIHLIGFSLGAHVSGTASESLKNKGFLLGRITGLDPASPLFRNNYLRENYKKLDRSDAKFVDVIHTDSSPFVTDGFGLWDPIGHVDFFPNGGQDQPGCNDVKDSIVVSHFERGLSKDLVCSHVRAFHLFKEALQNQLERKNGKESCEFVAYNCPRGMVAFEEGTCFPQIIQEKNSTTMDPAYKADIGRIGEDVRGEGVMFFATRSQNQYCGTQLQAVIELSNKSGSLRGVLQIQLSYKNNSMVFQMNCEFKATETSGKIIYGLGVADFNTLNKDITDVRARFNYLDTGHNERKTNNQTQYTPIIYFNKVMVRDMYGNRWEYCKENTKMEDPTGQIYGLLTVKMSKNGCNKYYR